MSQAQLSVTMEPVVEGNLLRLTVRVANAGFEDLWVAARAPFDLVDRGTLYVSAAEEGVVHLLLDDPVEVPYITVYQPCSAFYRLLSAGAEMTEAFQLPLPLIEDSPYEPADAEHAEAGEARPVAILRLSVGWKRPGSVRKVIPVEGVGDLSEIWGTDSGSVTVERRAPPGVTLTPRADPFTRF
jgi:hypothetical protein